MQDARPRPKDKRQIALTTDTVANLCAGGVFLAQVKPDGVTVQRWDNVPPLAALNLARAILSYYTPPTCCNVCRFGGMDRVYLDILAFLPPGPGNQFYAYAGETDTYWFYQTCEYCNPQAYIPPGFIPVPLSVIEAAVEAFCEVL